MTATAMSPATSATSLLLLHTWGGDARTWAPALRFLRAGGRAADAPDLPGHGERAAEPFSLAGAVETAAARAAEAVRDGPADSPADRLADVLEDRPVNHPADRPVNRSVDQPVNHPVDRPVDVVGSGLGALVALALARQRPGAVRSLTLVGFPPAGGPAAAARLAETEERLRRAGTAAFARGYVDGTLRGPDPARHELLRRAMAATRPRTLLDSLRATLGWADDEPPRPPGPPCLVLRGAHDERVGAEAAQTLAGQLGGTYAVVPGAGHVAYLDEPEAFAEVLRDFHHGLDRAAGGPAGRYGTEHVPPMRHSSGPPTPTLPER
ncbi:alpha/beta hydrolase [Streptomyces sp. L-9-10]|uniref:alpha/beta fold hydrolase n=1 Tax=Streptomyces sp. L-9-10 TaxID=1478131 RepID=UPI00101C6624|nr:alpha/beta hydrolase [Streptomyces sp. L-9-10]